ncbi:MAG TPA: response regulator [Polyangiaceae bacterium]|nr:response regulator [Polyangiaceae bacterium]
MPKTLLAVDDSATMRKVLEITFGGEDFRVVTADGASAAVSRLSDEPIAAVIDTSLGSDDGYALAKELRSRNARLALVVMSSRYSPYDANRGRDAGVDDYIDKPFDTQALIEKVKKAVIARETQAAAPAPKPAPAPAPAAAAPPPKPAPAPAAAQPPAPAAAAKRDAWGPTQRTHTLSFEGGLPVVPPPARPAAAPAPAPAPAAAAPPVASPVVHAAPPVAATAVPRAPVVASAPTPVATAAVVANVANGHLAGKLDGLGLTPQQAEAVLALSREVIERVVWEVVPQLAETIIKEEIARLTKEG